MANKGSVKNNNGNSKTYKVGIYARLSKEDTRSEESVSIENQKLLLVKHVKEMGWELVEIYQDDGFSGTNQNRPALQRLLEDVKTGRINTVLIKDLSRLGRNYLEVGNFSEVLLPQYGCELVSLNEKIDEMAVFRNWFNELHSRNTSIKVKAVKKMFAQDGKFGGAYAPYGYKKSPENKHKLIPDELTAPIIKKIFELRASGAGYNSIARTLNQEGITSPRDYFYRQKGEENHRRESHVWGSVSLAGILQNEVYIGNMVSMKYGSESYKSHRLVDKPKEDWIRVENTHEALIDRELWGRVQTLREKRYKPRPNKKGNTNMFTGIMICADCEMKMRHATQRRTRKSGKLYEHSNFACATYSSSGHIGCTPHIIAEKTLHEIVLGQIRSHAMLVKMNENRIMDNIMSQHTAENAASKKTFASELKTHNKRLAMLDKLIEKLYEDRLTGAIPETVFKNLIQKYEQERIERGQTVKTLKTRIANIKENTATANLWTKQIKQFTKIEQLDAEILLMLIDKIIVYEPKVIDGLRVCEIQIVYNHVGNMDWLAGVGETTDIWQEQHTLDKGGVAHGKAV
ncbi:MAG: recombinase family protein [Defluviitaleaceae bacterium]|nr:recombinase family protein [Defluviitaleaceae bacterium]